MATIAAGIVAPSQILRKLASYPRQNELALALREVGRIERTLFMIDWILDAGLQRQAQIGLNKGEAHHALKRAISFHRRGEIRDRSGEGQHYRIAGMILLAAIIIFWNTMKLGEVVNTRAASGTHIERSEEHTSELQSLMRISYAVFCLKKKKYKTNIIDIEQ